MIPIKGLLVITGRTTDSSSSSLVGVADGVGQAGTENAASVGAPGRVPVALPSTATLVDCALAVVREERSTATIPDAA